MTLFSMDHYNPYVDPWLYAYMLLTLCIQLLLCFRRGSLFQKFIPLIANVAVAALASAVFLPNAEWFGLVMIGYHLIVEGVFRAALAIASAWLILGVVRWIQAPQKLVSDKTS